MLQIPLIYVTYQPLDLRIIYIKFTSEINYKFQKVSKFKKLWKYQIREFIFGILFLIFLIIVIFLV